MKHSFACIGWIAAMALTGCATQQLASSAAAPDSHPSAHAVKSVSASESLLKLKQGNLRFANSAVSQGKPNAAKRAETAQHQQPYAVVVGCSDSRTSPELLFDQNLGDLFVVRTAGNLVDDIGLGSIEYAVEHLGSRLIVVLGHERCGAVSAALKSDSAPGHVNTLVRHIQPAVHNTKGAPGDPVENAVAENARLVAAHIRQKAELGALGAQVQIIPAVYDLDSGKVKWLTP
jgi:carbonic anhydrase